MRTLGINAAFHDSAACLVEDGSVVAAAEEERFTQIKHGKRPVPFSAWELPYHAIDYCLAEAGVDIDAVDHVAYSFEPGLFVNGSGMPSQITLPLEPSAIRVPAGRAPWDPLFLS
jgi:carbamoyltransferase